MGDVGGEKADLAATVEASAAEDWSGDASKDIANEVLEHAYDADETLTDGTKRIRQMVDR
jgi:hypothetical protein